MEILLFVAIALGGASVGSFLFLLQQRFDEDNRFSTRASVLRGRSHDEATKKPLKWYELIPLVSFLRQRGRSSYTQKKLSYRYFIHELVCAGIAIAGWMFLGGTKLAVFVVILLCLLYFLSVYDLRKHELHTGLWQLLIVWGIVGIILSGLWAESLLSAALFTGTMWLLYLAASRYAQRRYSLSEGLGIGDVWMAAGLGLMIPIVFWVHGLAWETISVVDSIVLFFLGSGIWGLCFALGEYAIKKEQHVAFIPGMVMSFVTLLFFLPLLLDLL